MIWFERIELVLKYVKMSWMGLAKSTSDWSQARIYKEAQKAENENPALWVAKMGDSETVRRTFKVRGGEDGGENPLSTVRKTMKEYYEFKQEATWFWQGIFAAVTFIDKSEMSPSQSAELIKECKQAAGIRHTTTGEDLDGNLWDLHEDLSYQMLKDKMQELET